MVSGLSSPLRKKGRDWRAWQSPLLITPSLLGLDPQ